MTAKQWITAFFALNLVVLPSFAQMPPAKIASYLDKHYAGWKLAPDKCGGESNKAVVRGRFNGDKYLDYAVKFSRRKKGYILAFVSKGREFVPFVLHDTTADDVLYLNLDVWKKGERFELGEQNVRPNYDAPSDFRCESDVGGIHLYRNGKFIGY